MIRVGVSRDMPVYCLGHAGYSLLIIIIIIIKNDEDAVSWLTNYG